MVNQESKVRTKRAFFIGFASGLALFAIVNMVSYPMSYSLRISPKLGLLDDGYAFGVPFAFYFTWLGVPQETAFVPLEAAVNMLIALLASLIIGLLLTKAVGRRVWEK